MTVTQTTTQTSAPVSEPIIQFKRRTIGGFLISFGAVATVVLLVAGGLLSWGAGFSADYIESELGSQDVTFPAAEALEAEGRTDLLPFAGKPVTTGAHGGCLVAAF